MFSVGEYGDVQNRLFVCLEVGNSLSIYVVISMNIHRFYFSTVMVLNLSVKCTLWWCSFD